MEQNKLDCCVVRDLLPTYIEGLTEPETAAQVSAHLEGCSDCREIETDMRSQVPVEPAPKKALNFLKHVKRTRLLAAILTLVLTLWCSWWLYDSEFHYSNTEAGRLAAVTDYVVSPADSTIPHVREGDPLRVTAWAERDGHLFIAFAADNENNVHGVVHLVRGINGKYEPLNSSLAPFPYTAGIWTERLWVKGSDMRLFALAGEGCREIWSARVDYSVMEEGALQYYTVSRTYEIPEPDFLWLIDYDTLLKDLGLEGKSLISLYADEIHLFDKNGNDVTEDYRDDSVSQSWAGGKGTAETFLLYVYIGIVALLGVLLIRYFLRKD